MDIGMLDIEIHEFLTTAWLSDALLRVTQIIGGDPSRRCF
jgi:hypothetical protein